MLYPTSDNAYQINNLATYNYNTASPYYQMVKQSSDENRAMVDTAYAQMQQLYQQRLAQQQQAQAAVQAQQLLPANSAPQTAYLDRYNYDYTDSVPTTAPALPVTPEAPGFLDQIQYRAIPQTLGSLQYGLGALSDFVGADTAGEWFKNKAVENFNYAEEKAPRQVGRIEDIDSFGDALTWGSETLADFVPTLVGAAVSGGAGLALAGVRGATQGVLSGMVQREIGKNVAKGMTKELAEKAAINTVKARGAQAGVGLFTGVQESGSAYQDNIATHGDEASAGRALATGAVSAAITGLIGMEVPFIRAITGAAAPAAAEQAVRGTILRGIRNGMLREGGEEALQETVQIINSKISDGSWQVTPEDFSRLANSAVAGGLLGGPLGGVSGYAQGSAAKRQKALTDAIKKRQDIAQDPTLTSALQEESPIVTPEERAQTGFELLNQERDRAVGALDQTYQAQRNALLGGFQQEVATLNSLSNPTNPEVINMDPKKRANTIKNAQRRYWDYIAGINTLDKQYETDKEAVIKQSQQTAKTLGKGLITAQNVQQSNKFYSDPVAYTQMSNKGTEAIRYATRTNDRITESTKLIQERLSDVRRRLRSDREVLADTRKARALKKEEASLIKELAHAQKVSRQLSKDASKIQKLFSNPTEDFGPNLLNPLVDSIFNADLPTSVRDADTLVDNATFTLYDNATSIMTEDRQALNQRVADRLREMEQANTASSLDSVNPYSDQLALPQIGAHIALPESLQSVSATTVEPQVEQQALPFGSPLSIAPAPTQQALASTPQQELPQGNGAIPMQMSEQDFYAQAEAEYAAQQAQAQREGVARTGLAVAEPNTSTPMAQPAGAIRPALPEKSTVAKAGFNPNPETGLNQGTTNAATKVHSLIQPSLKQLQGLGRVTVVLDVPSQVQGLDVDPTAVGAYDPVTNRVYLFAENILAEARVKSNKVSPNSKDIKDVAVRALVHEGVVHYGLSVLMTPAQRASFLKSVENSFKDHPLYKEIKKKYTAQHYAAIKRGDKPLIIAEEFLASLSEGNTIASLLEGGVSPKGKNYATVFNKLADMFKRILEKIGFSNVTREDILDVFKASAINLAQNTTQTIQSTPPVAQGQAAMSLPSQSRGTETNANFPSGESTNDFGPNEQVIRDSLQSKSVLQKAKDTLARRKAYGETFLEQVVDRLRPIQSVIKAMKDSGASITMANDVYREFQRVGNITSKAKEDAYNEVVSPFLDVVAAITPEGQDSRITLAQVSDYAMAKAALERNQHLGDGASGFGWTNEECQKIIDKLASPEMDVAFDMIQDINNYRLDIIEKNQLLPQEHIDALKEKYGSYMPLKAWQDIMKEENFQWWNSQGRKALTNATKQDMIGASATGSSKNLDNSVVHAIMQVYDVIEFKSKVDVDRSMLKLIEDNPTFTDFFEIDQIYTPEERADRKTRYIDSNGKLRWKTPKTKSQEHSGKILTLIDPKGNKVKAVVHHEGFKRAYLGENVARLSKPMQAMSALRRGLGQLITVYNPAFWITNLLRDISTAVVSAQDVQYTLRDYGIEDASGIGRAIMGKSFSGIAFHLRRAMLNGGKIQKTSGMSDEMYDYLKHYADFRDLGAQSSYWSTGGYEQQAKDLFEDIHSRNPQTRARAAKNSIETLGKHMRAISDALENQTRYTAFVEVYNRLNEGKGSIEENGVRRPLTDREAKQVAAEYALNLTVNFSRKGASAPVMDAFWMFSSANIAGNARLLQSMIRRDPVTGAIDKAHMSKFLTLPIVAYMGQAMLSRAIMPEDEDGVNMYDKIPSYVKERNIIIPFSDGSYGTIPVAYGLNVFWNAARNMIDSLYSASTGQPGPSFTEAATSSLFAGFDNFAPMGSVSTEGVTAFIPTVFRPLVQLAMNKNFAGNPIMPESTHSVRGEIPDSQKAWANTSDAYKGFAEGLNSLFGGSDTRSGMVDVSPETLEHLVTSYLGGFGRIMSSMADTMVKVQQGNFTSDDAFRLPVASSFYRTPQPSDTSALFTQYRTEIQTQINTVNKARTNPNMSTADKISVIRDNSAGMMMQKQLSRVQKQLNDIRNKERLIISNSKITGNARNKQLEQLEERKLSLMKQITKRAIELGVQLQ